MFLLGFWLLVFGYKLQVIKPPYHHTLWFSSVQVFYTCKTQRKGFLYDPAGTEPLRCFFFNPHEGWTDDNLNKIRTWEARKELCRPIPELRSFKRNRNFSTVHTHTRTHTCYESVALVSQPCVWFALVLLLAFVNRAKLVVFVWVL